MEWLETPSTEWTGLKTALERCSLLQLRFSISVSLSFLPQTEYVFFYISRHIVYLSVTLYLFSYMCVDSYNSRHNTLPTHWLSATMCREIVPLKLTGKDRWMIQVWFVILKCGISARQNIGKHSPENNSFSFKMSSLELDLFLNWCGPGLGLRKDNSEHGISLKIYWSNKIKRKVVS